MTPHQAAAKSRSSDVQGGTGSTIPHAQQQQSATAPCEHMGKVGVAGHQNPSKPLEKPDTAIANLPVSAPAPARPEATVPTTTPCNGASKTAAEPAEEDVQDFPDVPGKESMEFMEKMMANLRRVVRLEE